MEVVDHEQPNLELLFPGRRAAMNAVVGLWIDREDLSDAEKYVRELREDARFDRLK
jgi:hypothetical protein